MGQIRMYQLKITLQGTDPPVWRRVAVPWNVSLSHLHYVIQTSMGWWNSHLYLFEIKGRQYSDPDYELEDAKREGVPRQHFLYFFPLPHGQGALRPILMPRVRRGLPANAQAPKCGCASSPVTSSSNDSSGLASRTGITTERVSSSPSAPRTQRGRATCTHRAAPCRSLRTPPS